jgi:uncharacterized membrane protein
MDVVGWVVVAVSIVGLIFHFSFEKCISCKKRYGVTTYNERVLTESFGQTVRTYTSTSKDSAGNTVTHENTMPVNVKRTLVAIHRRCKKCGHQYVFNENRETDVF